MQLIKNSRLNELKRNAKLYELHCQEEIDVQKMLDNELRRFHRLHLEEINDLYEVFLEEKSELRQEHRLELVEKDQLIEELQDKLSECESKFEKKSKEAIRKATAELEESIAVRETAVEECELKLGTTDRELKAREKRLTAREAAVEKTEKELADSVTKHAKEVADARNDGEAIGEKRGYANGIADGIREISSQTATANERVNTLAEKAQDALIQAATKETKAPEVNVLAVPTATTSTPQKQK